MPPKKSFGSKILGSLYTAARRTTTGRQGGRRRGLLQAVQGGNVQGVRNALRMGGDPDSRYRPQQRDTEDTALMIAARSGDLDVVRQLIEAGADMNHRNNQQYTALMLAARNGHVDVVRLLVDARADVHHHNHQRDTALMLAAQNGHFHVVRRLVDAHADVNHHNHQGDTALMLAAMNGHRNVVRRLLQTDTPVDHRNNEGDTALTLAAQHGYVDIVRQLIDSGANVKSQNDMGNRALTLAAENGHLNVVIQLMKSDVEVNHQNNMGQTALMLAARNGHFRVVQQLVRRGALVDIRDNNDRDAIMYSSLFYINEDITMFLEVHHPRFGMRLLLHDTNYNRRLLDMARRYNIDIINAPDPYGNTPLSYAAANHKYPLVRILVEEYNADENIRNRNGDTVMDILWSHLREVEQNDLLDEQSRKKKATEILDLMTFLMSKTDKYKAAVLAHIRGKRQKQPQMNTKLMKHDPFTYLTHMLNLPQKDTTRHMTGGAQTARSMAGDGRGGSAPVPQTGRSMAGGGGGGSAPVHQTGGAQQTKNSLGGGGGRQTTTTQQQDQRRRRLDAVVAYVTGLPSRRSSASSSPRPSPHQGSP